MGSREMGRHWSSEEKREIPALRQIQGKQTEVSQVCSPCKSHSDDKVAKGLCCQTKKTGVQYGTKTNQRKDICEER